MKKYLTSMLVCTTIFSLNCFAVTGGFLTQGKEIEPQENVETKESLPFCDEEIDLPRIRIEIGEPDPSSNEPPIYCIIEYGDGANERKKIVLGETCDFTLSGFSKTQPNGPKIPHFGWLL